MEEYRIMSAAVSHPFIDMEEKYSGKYSIQVCVSACVRVCVHTCLCAPMVETTVLDLTVHLFLSAFMGVSLKMGITRIFKLTTLERPKRQEEIKRTKNLLEKIM